MYVFPKRCEGEEVLKHIFPTKQRAVQTAIELARQDKRIKRLIIFGSAVTLKCGTGSDVDIAIDAPNMDFDSFLKIAHPFYCEVPSEIDVIHFNNVKSELLKENIKKGVCVYARK